MAEFKKGEKYDPTEQTYDVSWTQYGFKWGDCLVERTCSNGKKPKFQILRVYAPNGEGVEITMTPRTLKAVKFEKYKERGE